MSPSSFFVVSLGFSVCSILSSASNETLTLWIWSPFQFGFLLYIFFFFWLLCLDSKTMLNKSGESRHHCLIPDLRGNTFNLSPLSMMLAVGLLCISFFYYFELCSLYAACWRGFICLFVCLYHKWMWSLSKDFSASIEMIIWLLFFNLLNLQQNGWLTLCWLK